MVKLKLLKKWDQWDLGDVVEFDRNDAHTLIDKGVAKVFTGYENKMLVAKERKFKAKIKRSYLSK